MPAHEFARRADICLSLVKQIECGAKPLTVPTANKIAYAFTVPVGWLLNGDPAGDVPAVILSDFMGPPPPYDAQTALLWSKALRGSPVVAMLPEIQAQVLKVAESQAQAAIDGMTDMLLKAFQANDGRIFKILLRVAETMDSIRSDYFPEMAGIENQAAPSSARKGRR